MRHAKAALSLKVNKTDANDAFIVPKRWQRFVAHLGQVKRRHVAAGESRQRPLNR